MLFPIRTDSPIKRTPWINYALIAVNVLVFLASHNYVGTSQATRGRTEAYAPWVRTYLLESSDPQLYQFFTYQFLHGNLMHLLGNMLFLWVFGNSVNAKMGHLTYVLFYLGGGVFAAFGYSVFSDLSMLGASGAIAAVTTGYLALFPRSNIEFIYWWFIIGTIELPSMFIIILKMILWDNIIAPSLEAQGGPVQVAYGAHLAGYLYGFVVGVLLLWTRALPRDQFDIVALWRRWYQRQSVASALRDPTARAVAELGRVARPVRVEPGAVPPLVDHVSDLRMRAARALADRDRVAAAELYQELLTLDPAQTLSRDQQLEVAYQLCAMGRIPQAVAAYERYVQAYPGASDADQVRLLLGILFARDLGQYERAREYLLQAHDRLTDSKRRQQCQEWLDVANRALERETHS